MKTKRSSYEIEESDKENIYPFAKYQKCSSILQQQDCKYGLQQEGGSQQHEHEIRSPIKLIIKKQNGYWMANFRSDDVNTSTCSTNSLTSSITNSSLNNTSTSSTASRYQLRLRNSRKTIINTNKNHNDIYNLLISKVKVRTQSSNPILETVQLQKPLPKKTTTKPKKAATTTAIDLTKNKLGRKEENSSISSDSIVRPSSELSETEYKELIEKARTSQIRVRLNRSNLRIALVEGPENILCSLAKLDVHLFKYRTAPCIYCPRCLLYMSIEQFGNHVHGNDEHEAALIRKKPGVLYNMIPCNDDLSTDLSPENVELWNLFLARVSKFNVFQPKSQKLD